MRHRKALAAALFAAALAGAGGGAALAAVTSSPAAQVTDPDVYACVNPAGGIDYLEFRLPLPHRCWFANEQLWRWSVNPVPGPTVTAPAG
jgi:hypothetical protein